MKKIDHLKMYHKMLDEQIDEMERLHKFPDPQQEKTIADLKKQRLNIRDGILQLEAQDAELVRHKNS